MGIPRESVEFVVVSMTVDGDPAVPNGIAICGSGQRPTTWLVPETLEGKAGFMTGDLAPATYTVYARADDNPETPVVKAGTLTID